MIECKSCRRELGEPAASIHGDLMGDRLTDRWFLCPACDAYTVRTLREPFMGEDEVTFRGPVSRADGDEITAVIAGCPDPMNEDCRCPAHRRVFGPWLK